MEVEEGEVEVKGVKRPPQRKGEGKGKEDKGEERPKEKGSGGKERKKERSCSGAAKRGFEVQSYWEVKERKEKRGRVRER